MNKEKLEEIQKRINKFKTLTTKSYKLKNELNAFSIAIDLVSGVMVGVLLGLGADKLFNSKPLFLIIFILIGILAGFKIIFQKLKNDS